MERYHVVIDRRNFQHRSGDAVILLMHDKNRGKLPLAIVELILPDNDSITRTVRLESNDGTPE